MHWICGLDLGQTDDFTALAVIRLVTRPHPIKASELESHYTVAYLKRWQLGTPYPEIVRDVCRIVQRPPLSDPMLAIDRTGVGRGVYDMFVEAQPAAWLRPIVITGGHQVSESDDRSLHVPKKDLVASLKAVIAGARLFVVDGLEGGDVLKKELGNFKVKLTKAANETFGARDGQHDDLVLAVALACWIGETTNACWDGSLGLAKTVDDGQNVAYAAPRSMFGSAPNPWQEKRPDPYQNPAVEDDP